MDRKKGGPFVGEGDVVVEVAWLQRLGLNVGVHVVRSDQVVDSVKRTVWVTSTIYMTRGWVYNQVAGSQAIVLFVGFAIISHQNVRSFAFWECLAYTK